MMRGIALLILCGAALALVLTGCEGERGPAGPAGYNPIEVMGSLRYHPSPVVPFTFFSLEVQGSPTIPSVSLNGEDYAMAFNSTQNAFTCNYPVMTFSPGDSVVIEIDYVKNNGDPGVARIRSLIPAPAEPIVPLSPIAWGGDLVWNWLSVPGADGYDVYFSHHCRYSDTLGIPQDYYWSCHEITTDTVLTFSAADLWPADMAALHGPQPTYAELRAYPINGPFLPGEPGNVTGDGTGFFTCTVDTDPVTIEFTD
ncbi:MAG: hypothetical protein C4524_08205 [Candidatus Zixiibacteriota bacterium]|nr:MAG: hypothetical protein C4524_08205 [candidate division Zixibacteria bacterium]